MIAEIYALAVAHATAGHFTGDLPCKTRPNQDQFWSAAALFPPEDDDAPSVRPTKYQPFGGAVVDRHFRHFPLKREINDVPPRRKHPRKVFPEWWHC